MGPTNDATKLSLCCNVGKKENLSLIWTSWTSGPAYGAQLICGSLTSAWTWVLYPKRQILDLWLCHVASWGLIFNEKWSSMRNEYYTKNNAYVQFQGAWLHFERSVSAFSAAVCKIQARKRYIESLPSVLQDKRSRFSHGKNLPYSCLLVLHLPSGSRILNWQL